MIPAFQATFRAPTGHTRSDTGVEVLLNERLVASSSALLDNLSPKRFNCHSTFNMTVEEEVFGEIEVLLSTGRVDVNAKNLERLTHVAHQYNMTGLHKFCERLYLNHLSPGRCLKLWLLAMDNNLTCLQAEALKLIREHFDTISEKESFCHIGKYQVEKLILDPAIMLKFELVCKAIENWSQYSSEQDLRVEDKAALIQTYNQNYMCMSMNNGNLIQESGNNRLLDEESNWLPSRCSIQHTRRVSESQNSLETIWIAKTKANKLCVLGMRLDEGNVLPELHRVSFPTKMEGISAFWYCTSRRCMYASNDHDTWRLDGHSKWTRCSNLPAGRTHHMLCGVGHKMYALGGYDNQSLHLTEYVLEYGMKTDKWTDFSHAGKLHKKVESGQCVAIDEDIYVFGGFSVDEQGNLLGTYTAQRYNAKYKTCEKLSDLPFKCSGRGHTACAVTDGGYIYIFSSAGQVVRYIPNSDQYHSLPSYPKPRIQFGTFIEDDMLYIFGGQHKSGPIHDIHCLDLREENSEWHRCGMLDMPMLILSSS